jgi:hypothetical protein
MIDLKLNPSRKDLRVFAVLFWVFFTGVAYIVFRRTGSTAIAGGIAAAAALVGIVGLAVPKVVRPVYIVWMLAAFPIGWLLSHVLMGVIYYLVVTPVGMVMRMLGRDPMRRGFDAKATTYWIPRTNENDQSRYFRQF